MTHPAFELLRTEKIESLNLEVQEFRHQGTGAVHYHLRADNPENVFLVALRTAPKDSTGVAHILEHTVLCGSEKYPVRDPFFMMIRRSLNTFMNAFTSSDWTAYPFASQNRKDYFNLLDVYLDAVFFSNLHELDFAQEGHRLEFDDGDKLEYKGVVYNEMKGAMSSPVNRLWQTVSKYLYPVTTYHYNSGGEPDEIPNLSYEGLKEFYRVHYHPSNAVFMTYGDIEVDALHTKFEDNVLSRFERSERRIVVEDEVRYHAPVNVEEYYPVDPAEQGQDKTHLVLAWLLGPSTDLKQRLRAELMTSVLLENSASPLQHVLETTELGTAPSPLCGLDDSNKEMNFMCGIEGSRPEHAQRLERLVLDTLQQVAAEGVPQSQLEAALHQLEISQREIGGDGYPYGLQLILNGLGPAIHYADPIALLNLDEVLEQLREESRQPDFVQSLVRQNLLDNPHRVRVSLIPDPGLSHRRQAFVERRLTSLCDSLSAEQKQQIQQQSAALQARQSQQDDEEILPKVTIDDVPEKMPVVEGELLEHPAMPVHFYAQGCNGLVYQQCVVTLPEMPQEMLDAVSHFVHLVPEVGFGDKDYLQVQSLQSEISGGVSAFTSVRADAVNMAQQRGFFVLSSKALNRNAEAVHKLLKATLETARFDETARLQELISQRRARREAGITNNGHSYAMMAAASTLSPMAAFVHRQQGLKSIQLLQQLDAMLQKQESTLDFKNRMEQIHRLILSQPMQLLLVAEQEQRTSLQDMVEQVWSAASVSDTQAAGFSLHGAAAQNRQAWLTNTEVNFCAKAYPTVPMTHPDAAALAVLGGFLRNGYLHRAIREQGGAYGGGASHDAGVCAFRFYSYRDPRLEQTLDDFDRAVHWLFETKHEWRQVEEAILGVISSIDKPGSPAGNAKEAFYNVLHGRTPALREQFRQRVLAVTAEDLCSVAERYLQPERASVAVVTHQAGLETIRDKGFEVFQL